MCAHAHVHLHIFLSQIAVRRDAETHHLIFWGVSILFCSLKGAVCARERRGFQAHACLDDVQGVHAEPGHGARHPSREEQHGGTVRLIDRAAA